ncbi:Nup85 nucleoporin-domain-containing protein [Aspergillus heterothallicus]
MSFKWDFGSPSMPGKPRNPFGNGSTSPGQAPPSPSNSFTPQGPPPSTIHGGSTRSQDFSPKPIFNRSELLKDSIFGSSIDSPDFMSRTKKTAPAKSFGASQSLFSVSGNTRFGESTDWGVSNDFGSLQMEEELDQEEEVEEDNGPMEEEEEDEVQEQTGRTAGSGVNFFNTHISNTGPQSSIPPQRKSIYMNPGDTKRPKLDERWTSQSPLRKAKLSSKKDSPIPAIVRNFASRGRATTTEEPSDFILRTEDEISRMYEEVKQAEQYGQAEFENALSGVCSRLSTVWETSNSNDPSRTGTGIGPGDNAPNFAKATFLGSLLLQLHHPPFAATRPTGFPNFGFGGPRALLLAGGSDTPIATPKVLLDWLETHHATSAELRALAQVGPDPTASPNFWEILNGAVLRGKFSEVAKILRSADFNYARSALEDGLSQSGYRGVQLQNIQRCINKVLPVLESCPSVQHDDWDVRGAEWALYRKRVLSAVSDLEEFAEGDEQPVPQPAPKGNAFQAVNFGLGPSPFQGTSFTDSARMAESKVPWAIYQNLRTIYRIILGDPSAILNLAQNWVEATIGLTVWWDGEDDEDSFLHRAPNASENPYLRRLNLAFSSATNGEASERSFRINSLSGLEAGLASVFEGNVEGVLELLQTWSLCVASAVAEISAVGGWLETGGVKPPSGLSENDLMVLSYGQENVKSRRMSKDDVLTAYALALFERRSIDNEIGTREGWELALEVLSRLDDREKGQKSVSDLLDKLPLDTAEQMDKVVLLCTELGLDKEGRRVSERYGDMTVSDSEEYGLALVCYARAHNRRKVRSVVDLLISYSLVHSRAYPATSNLDNQLRALIREPKACLQAIASADDEAASILQFYFSGYATLRRFYETRDEAIGLAEGHKPRYKPLARRRAAAQALVAVISSAADSIYGGLYDPDRDSAIQVDGLLALLGEALPLVHENSSILTTAQQFAILSAIEDLETVTPRVYAQCEECFRSTLLEYSSSKHGFSGKPDSLVLPPSPRALLKKSVSSLTGSSTFSIIGTDMLESARTGSYSGSAEGSGVLVPRSEGTVAAEREWDWRAGLTDDAKGEDILRMLRLGLAGGLSLGALGRV